MAVEAGLRSGSPIPGLLIAQIASVAGSVFTIAGAAATVAAASMGAGAAGWAAVAATFGLVGAVLAIGGTIFVLLLIKDKWITWLRDIPLNKERKAQEPVHKSLSETMQELVNAQAELQAAWGPTYVHP